MSEETIIRTAVVTGGSRGIGRAVCIQLAKQGCNVVVNYCHGEAAAAETVALCKAENADAVAVQADVSTAEGCKALFEQAVNAFGRVDILVNNAGNHCKKFIWDMTVDDYKRVLDVHLVGAFALTKAFVPQMKEQGHGRIIFQASMTSYIGQPQVAGYSTAKAGYLGLIHTLTAELAEYGITVNAIAPGWIDTPMFHKATDNDPPRLAKIMGRIPAKSVGDPMDVGMCAAFLCSDAARYISGTCIPVDGGALIGF